jgi:hypothetical protein
MLGQGFGFTASLHDAQGSPPWASWRLPTRVLLGGPKPAQQLGGFGSEGGVESVEVGANEGPHGKVNIFGGDRGSQDGDLSDTGRADLGDNHVTPPHP